MKKILALAAFGAWVAAAYACTRAPRYPSCESDAQCATATSHDYCVSGTCVYCRSAIDCREREMCRAGKCLPDPELALPDGGDDADVDAAPDADAEEPDEPVGRKRRYRVLPVE